MNIKKSLYSLLVIFELFTSSCGMQTPTPLSYIKPISYITLPPSPTETIKTATPLTFQGCAGQSSLRIRSNPGTQTDIFGGIASGKCVSILGRNQDSSWVWIKTDEGITGWVFAENLNIVGEISQLSVIKENEINGISQIAIPTLPSILPTTKLPAKTKTPFPTQFNTYTPRPLPTSNILLCKDTYKMVGSNVECKIPKAYCSYQSTTNGSPTFCNDAPYPNHNFIWVCFI
jgi:uncharacterized protein YraI